MNMVYWFTEKEGDELYTEYDIFCFFLEVKLKWNRCFFYVFFLFMFVNLFLIDLYWQKSRELVYLKI